MSEDYKNSREFEKLMLYEAKTAGDLYVQKVAENLDKIQNEDGSFSMDKYIAGMSQMPDLLKNKPFQKVELPELSEERKQEILAMIGRAEKTNIFQRTIAWMRKKIKKS